MTIDEAVKSLRKRAGKTQLQFAQMLMCQRNTVSRYEKATFPPGPLILLRLLQLTNSGGIEAPEEAAAIMRELNKSYERGDIGGGRDAEETVAFMVRSPVGEMLRGEQIMGLLSNEKRLDFGFRQFVPAVAKVIETCDTVDGSVTEVLQLWSAHSQEEKSAAYFRKAVEFLKTRLWSQSQARPRRSSDDPNLADLVRDQKRAAVLQKRLAKLKAAEAVAGASKAAAEKPDRSNRRRSASVK